MTDIPCPVCGKLNPAGLVECQFCQAEIPSQATSPVEEDVQGLAPSAEDSQGEPPEREEDIPAKASSLSAQDNVKESGESAASQEIDSEVAGWLQKIRGRLAHEQGGSRMFRKGRASIQAEQGEEFQDDQRVKQVDPEPVIRSADFPAEGEPEPQPGDTLPSVPEHDFSLKTGEYQDSASREEGEGLPEKLINPPPVSTVSYNLRLTGSQHAHADLLRSIVEEEGSPAALIRRRPVASYPFLRWAIGAVLIFSILWPIVMDRQSAPLPVVGEEAGQVNNLIEQLPEESRVLLAFDYDPGFSGELESAAAGVIGHLVSKRAYLTLVSTLPTGPVVAELFFSNTAGREEFARDLHYVNLGFIPGGPAGLLSFAENFRQAMPYTLEGKAAWFGGENPEGSSAFQPLDGITEISDFNLVMILVDDPFTARSWIEQVQPHLIRETFRTPMAVVVSAQVAPIVRPYYDSYPRQVQGVVSGLRGGITYEQLTGRAGQASNQWDAFSSGMNITGLLILIGALMGIVYTLFWPHDREGNGGRV
jgi:hypothetical protein